MVPRYQLNYILSFSITQAREVHDGHLSSCAIFRPSLVFKAHVLPCPIPVYSPFSPQPAYPIPCNYLQLSQLTVVFDYSVSAGLLPLSLAYSTSLNMLPTNEDNGLALSISASIALYLFPPQIAKLISPFRR